MSHVVDSKVLIKDLACLKKACEASKHLELVEGQKTYAWWGRSVGDYPVPAGFTTADLGKCDHVIRVRKDSPYYRENASGYSKTYEVGVVKSRTGEGFTFLYDFYGNGNGLVSALRDFSETEKSQTPSHMTNTDHEHDFDHLMQEYTLQVAEQDQGIQDLLLDGWQVERVKQENKDIQLRVFQN